MQLSDRPDKLVIPFAESGGKNPIPVPSQPAGAASLTDGFPPLTRTPLLAGGIPPSGLDMNGALYEISALARWAGAGAGAPYDGTFATDVLVNGYPKGARVLRSDGTGYWLNTVDNNVTDPESSGVGWVQDTSSTIASISLSSSNVTLTPLQYNCRLLEFLGALVANINVIFPAIVGVWHINNDTEEAFSVTCKTASGGGVSLPQGRTSTIFCNGTDMYLIDSVGRFIKARYFTTPGANSYTPTPGANRAIVEVVGGGGAGGGSTVTGAGEIAAGGGGGAGGYCRKLVTALSPVTITVGAGGASVHQGNGGNGGTSSFGAVCSATGGTGGPVGTAGTSGNGTGFPGGNGFGGDLNVDGQAGGGAFGIGSLPLVYSGFGGSSMFGAGGRNTYGYAAGHKATGFGSGGGGSSSTPSTAGAQGGPGAGGIVIVWEYQ